MMNILKNVFSRKQSFASVKNQPARRTFLTLETLETRDNPSALVPGTFGHAPSAVAGATIHVGAPYAPSFTATAVSGTQVNLAWYGVSGANGYVVDEWVNGAWKQIGNLGSGSTSASVTGLSPNTTYYFDLGAYDYYGTSWANYRSVTTLQQQGPPLAPSFTATAASGTQINLAWNGVSGANGYLVDEWVNGAWKQIGNMGGGSTGASVTGLSPNTTYYFDVAAYNAYGTSWASYKSATTSGITISVNHPTAGATYSPVSGSLFGPNGPSYLDVVQGQVGDCWLLSSLAEVATRAPADIRNMFAYNGTTVENGSTVSLYTVRFFNTSGVATYVQVDTELPGGGSMYDHIPANGALWVALAEKAYAEANGAGYVTTGSLRSDSYNALNDGNPAWALQAITGKGASDYSINPTNIAAAWNAGELVVLCTTSPSSHYIVGGHCYAVVGYNPSSSLPFEVLNPWGGSTSSVWCPQDTQVYGLFSANAAFISQNFASQGIGVGAEQGTGLPANIGSAITPSPRASVAPSSSFTVTGASANASAAIDTICTLAAHDEMFFGDTTTSDAGADASLSLI